MPLCRTVPCSRRLWGAPHDYAPAFVCVYELLGCLVLVVNVMHVSPKCERFIDAHTYRDGSRWTGQQLDVATVRVVTRSHVTNLRKDRLENPGFERQYGWWSPIPSTTTGAEPVGPKFAQKRVDNHSHVRPFWKRFECRERRPRPHRRGPGAWVHLCPTACRGPARAADIVGPGHGPDHFDPRVRGAGTACGRFWWWARTTAFGIAVR
jgi:hypothetical protein